MRLGAMLSGSATGVLEHASIARSGDRLVLTLRGPAREFAGEAVERRLQMLAARLGCPGRISAGGVSGSASPNAKAACFAGRFRLSSPDLGQRQRVDFPAPVRAGHHYKRPRRLRSTTPFPAGRTKPASCTGCNAEIT